MVTVCLPACLPACLTVWLVDWLTCGLNRTVQDCMPSSPTSYGSANGRDAALSNSGRLEMQHKRAVEPLSPLSTGFQAEPLSSTRGADSSTQLDDDNECDEEDHNGWHVAIVPTQLLSSPRSSSFSGLLTLLSVAFSAIKHNIVTHTHTDTQRSSLSACRTCHAAHTAVGLWLLCGVVCGWPYQIPGLVLQCFAVLLLVLFYSSSTVAAAFQSVASIKEQSARQSLQHASVQLSPSFSTPHITAGGCTHGLPARCACQVRLPVQWCDHFSRCWLHSVVGHSDTAAP